MKKWFALLGILAAVGVIILLARPAHSPLAAEPVIQKQTKKWEHPLLLPSSIPGYSMHVSQADARDNMYAIQVDLTSQDHQVGYLLISESYTGDDKITHIPGQREGESLDDAVARLSKTKSDNTGVKTYEHMKRFKIGDSVGYAYKIHDTHAGSQYESLQFLQNGLLVYLYSDILPQSRLITIAQSFHTY